MSYDNACNHWHIAKAQQTVAYAPRPWSPHRGLQTQSPWEAAQCF